MEGRISFPSPPIPSSFPDGCERGPKRGENFRPFLLLLSQFCSFSETEDSGPFSFPPSVPPTFWNPSSSSLSSFQPLFFGGQNWGREKSLLSSSSFSLFGRGSFYDVRMSEESTFACFRMRLFLLEKLPSGEKRRHWRRPLITEERLKQGSRLNPPPPFSSSVFKSAPLHA